MISIKSLSLEDRPREKMLERGISALTDAELLAIIIGSGTKQESAISLSQKIINTSGGLNQLAQKEVNELVKIKGIGPAKAINILVAFELGRRKSENKNSTPQKISSSNLAYELMKNKIADLKYEEFWLVMLNRANIPTRKLKISKGGVSGTVVDTKIIIKEVANELASGVLIYHNHPSGNLSPSTQDKTITQKLKSALQIIDVNLLDHIIITPNQYYSFADNGEI